MMLFLKKKKQIKLGKINFYNLPFDYIIIFTKNSFNYNIYLFEKY